jgi:hypothetical protein
MPVKSLGLLDHLVWSQRVRRRAEHRDHELGYPPRPLRPERGLQGDGALLTRCARDRVSGLGHPPKLNPDFRVRKCARQLYDRNPCEAGLSKTRCDPSGA